MPSRFTYFRKVALTVSLIFIIAAINFGHNPDLSTMEPVESRPNVVGDPVPQYSTSMGGEIVGGGGGNGTVYNVTGDNDDDGGSGSGSGDNNTSYDEADDNYDDREDEKEEAGDNYEEEEAEEEEEEAEEEEGDNFEEEEEAEEEEDGDNFEEEGGEEDEEEEEEEGDEGEEEGNGEANSNVEDEKTTTSESVESRPEESVKQFDTIGTSKNQLFQCENESDQRFSDGPFTPSAVKSLVNCDLPDAMCKYFYPANFFDKDCGLGKKYRHFITEMEDKRVNGTLWNFMPAVGFPTLTMNNVCLSGIGKPVRHGEGDGIPPKLGEKDELQNIGRRDNENQSWCMTERLSFLHVHKAGGSSLHNAFNSMSMAQSSSLTRHKFFSPSRNPGTPVPERSSQMRDVALRSLEHAIRYPTEKFESEQHVILAVVRDPTERFISSIGQAMGASGSGGNHIAPILKKACIKETSKETLKCVAKYVKEHTFWIELHFTPQIMDISFTTLYQDVPIAVFPFQKLNDVLDYFGKKDVKIRNGSSAKYRSDPVLTNMSVNDYDEETLKIVCEIYEMDVYMQRSLGYEVPRCDPYIPHLYKFEH